MGVGHKKVKIVLLLHTRVFRIFIFTVIRRSVSRAHLYVSPCVRTRVRAAQHFDVSPPPRYSDYAGVVV